MRKQHDPFLVRSLIAALLIAASGSAFAQQQEAASATSVAFPAANAHSEAKLTARIIEAPNGTFGYEVLSDGALFVRQTNVPGRPGNNGCPKREQAEKLSALVIEKIQRGEMPPTVSQNELKALGL